MSVVDVFAEFARAAVGERVERLWVEPGEATWTVHMQSARRNDPTTTECMCVALDVEDLMQLGGSVQLQDQVKKGLRRAADVLTALVSSSVPDGATWMAIGATRVFGDDLKREPITLIDRTERMFQRAGDPGPQPWPRVVFRTERCIGIVEFDGSWE